MNYKKEIQDFLEKELNLKIKQITVEEADVLDTEYII